MKIEHSTSIAFPPKAVLDAMLSEGYLTALANGLEPVSQVAQIEQQESENQLTRTLRYTAPTAGKIPSFLSKWKEKAPSHVTWDEFGVWNLETKELGYSIKADVREEWQQYYSAAGRVELTPEGDGGTVLKATLVFKVNVFGLGGMIEKALKREVAKILVQQGEITKQFVQEFNLGL